MLIFMKRLAWDHGLTRAVLAEYPRAHISSPRDDEPSASLPRPRAVSLPHDKGAVCPDPPWRQVAQPLPDRPRRFDLSATLWQNRPTGRRMRFSFRHIDRWPPLAWLARCLKGSDTCQVQHGDRVEIRRDWFCEAVWPDEFENGGFDRTDLVAGSGARIRDDRVIFVSSGNTVDRLLWLDTPNEAFVSNSLACLIAASGVLIDESYPHFYEDFSSIMKGLHQYKRTISTNAGDIGIQIFDNIEWNGRTLATRIKELQPRDFGNFSNYEAFLLHNLGELSRNISSAGRQHKYRFLATISAGYDSPSVAALAKRVGCTEALCIDRDRFGEEEKGDVVARSLGMQTTVIPRDSWRELDGAEIPFLAADGDAESVPLATAHSRLEGAVLLTGYHGDKMWAKHTKDLSDNIVRGDHGGLSLTEFRLWAGFIHCPITFWGVRQIRDLNRISNSDEMRPWDVGEDYSRPIPRRIVEGAGVPRGLFGTAKRASAVGHTEALSPHSLEAYKAWLGRRRMVWIRRGRIPPLLSDRYEDLSQSVRHTVHECLKRLPVLWRLAADDALESPSHLRRYVFAWALSILIERYRAGLQGPE